MQKETNEKQPQSFLKHPFVIVLGIIVIFYGGYLFGQRLYELWH